MSAAATDSDAELQELASRFESWSPQEILRVATDRYHPDVALATAFGAEGMVLLNMLSRIRPDAAVMYIDTQLFFRPTYDLIERAKERYPFRWVRLLPELTPEQQAARHGPELYKRDPDACCRMRKVEPMGKHVSGSGLRAWITGLRREQSPTRASVPAVHRDPVYRLVKFNPLVRWTSDEVWSYIREHDVPYNTLHDHGYPSIGCWPCTKAVRPGDHPRAGRWSGTTKTECGLNRA